MNAPTTAQIQSAIRWLLSTGGPLAAMLTNAGMQPGTLNTILTIALAVGPPIVSFIWSQMSHTDRATAVAASNIQGVTVHVDPVAAPANVVATANDPTVANVVPKGP